MTSEILAAVLHRHVDAWQAHDIWANNIGVIEWLPARYVSVSNTSYRLQSISETASGRDRGRERKRDREESRKRYRYDGN